MAANRTGVSTLRQLLRAVCKLVQQFPNLVTDPAVPTEISVVVVALVTACLASDFENTHAGEVSGQGTIP
jgi:hypothetical protein